MVAVKPIRILLIEDSPTDVELTYEAMRRAKVANELDDVSDGEAAMRYLRQVGEFTGAPRPDLILLDLNLPRKSGREILEEVKADADLCVIPVIVLTTSDADEDVMHAYRHHVNAYVRKPIDFKEFISVVDAIEAFWVSIVTLPRNPG